MERVRHKPFLQGSLFSFREGPFLEHALVFIGMNLASADLLTFLDGKTFLPPVHAAFIAVQILKGLEHLHAVNIFLRHILS